MNRFIRQQARYKRAVGLVAERFDNRVPLELKTTKAVLTWMQKEDPEAKDVPSFMDKSEHDPVIKFIASLFGNDGHTYQVRGVAADIARSLALRRQKSKAAVELGHQGGEARAQALAREQRIHIAARGGKAKSERVH